jgi:hypothetical protein
MKAGTNQTMIDLFDGQDLVASFDAFRRSVVGTLDAQWKAYKKHGKAAARPKFDVRHSEKTKRVKFVPDQPDLFSYGAEQAHGKVVQGAD